MTPKDCKFLKSHEWARPEGDTVTVGITHHAVKHLSDLVFLDLPPAGKKVVQGQSFGEVESVKAVSDIYSPVTGEVTEVNTDLPEHLDKLTSDPYGEGWMIKVKVGPDSGVESLLSPEDYEALIQQESD